MKHKITKRAPRGATTLLQLLTLRTRMTFVTISRFEYI